MEAGYVFGASNSPPPKKKGGKNERKQNNSDFFKLPNRTNHVLCLSVCPTANMRTVPLPTEPNKKGSEAVFQASNWAFERQSATMQA